MIGETISHYKIKAKIGPGGMGEIYRGEDTSLKREDPPLPTQTAQSQGSP